MTTVGTDAYTIIEHCLTLAKAFIEQGNFYVRLRRMRDTQDTNGGGR